MRWLLHTSWKTVHYLTHARKCVMLGSVCNNCLLKSWNLVPKALVCAYSWPTTAFCPCRLKFSAFRCFVMSTEKSQICQPYSILQFLHWLSLISKKLSKFPFKRERGAGTSERGGGIGNYFVLTTCFITWSNLRCFTHKTCWWIIQWS